MRRARLHPIAQDAARWRRGRRRGRGDMQRTTSRRREDVQRPGAGGHPAVEAAVGAAVCSWEVRATRGGRRRRRPPRRQQRRRRTAPAPLPPPPPPPPPPARGGGLRSSLVTDLSGSESTVAAGSASEELAVGRDLARVRGTAQYRARIRLRLRLALTLTLTLTLTNPNPNPTLTYP